MLEFYSFLCPETEFISNSDRPFKKTIFFDSVNFIDEENIVTYVAYDCGNVFHTDAPTGIGHINRDRKTLPDCVKNPSASRVTINITGLLMKSETLIS